MRKMTSTLSVFALICAMTVSAFAQMKEMKNVGFHCNAGNGNGKVPMANYDGKALLSLTSVDGGKTWTLDAKDYVCPVCGRIDWVAYSNNSGKLNGNNIQLNHSASPEYPVPVDDDDDPVVVNLGFIGYYVYDGIVMNTSIHWQILNEGDMIDWDAVDAAYAEWVAQGGFEPERLQWQTSGYASFTFDDYARLGYDNFNIGQLEDYYKAYYVDPGYILPEDKVVANLIFQAFFRSAANPSVGWWGEFFSMQVTLGEETFLDWDGIFAEYEVANTAGRFAPNWWSATSVMDWFTSSGGANNGRQTLVQVNGEWPNPVVFTKEMFEAVTTGSNDEITITIRPTLNP